MNDIMKIIKFLEESGLLIKGVCETIKNEAKKQNGGVLTILFGTLGASLLGNLLTGKRTIRTSEAEDKTQLKHVGIFNVASSFNKFWNTKIFSKET